jgi:hypothetical protein
MYEMEVTGHLHALAALPRGYIRNKEMNINCTGLKYLHAMQMTLTVSMISLFMVRLLILKQILV